MVALGPDGAVTSAEFDHITLEVIVRVRDELPSDRLPWSAAPFQ